MALALIAVLCTACGTKKSTAQQHAANNPFGEVFSIPCEVYDSETHFAATGIYKGSMNQKGEVHIYALQNAQAIVRQKMQHAYKGLVGDYSQSVGNNRGNDIATKIEKGGDQIINVIVNNAAETCVKYSGVDDRGMVECYAESPHPTIDDMVTNMGNTKSPIRFESRITNLKMDTRYYVRAYAINNVGVAYSTHEIDFFTSKEPTIPVVRTEDVTSVTGATAMVGGVVESLGNVSKISAYGHVWAQRTDPTLGSGKYSQLGEKSETGAFTSSLDGLQPNTTYYVRAYATNEVGTAYGESKVFTTAKRDVAVSTNEVTEK